MYKTVECSPPGAAPAFRMPAARSHSWSMVVMIKQHLKQNVYEAFLERLKFIFEEFDNIYISFSGGKDSGLLLNLVLITGTAASPKRRWVFFIRISKRSTL